MKYLNWEFNTVPVFLIGMPFSGKSGLAKAISVRTNKPFIDLDKKIEEKASASVGMIFDKFGEEAFRDIESEVLRSLDLSSAPVVACGGGTPCYRDNLNFMEDKGILIYVFCPMNELALRANLAEDRPLFKNTTPEELHGKLEDMLHKREIFYSKADIILKNHTKEGRLLELGLSPL
jgi:shikimate kinase